MDETIVSQEDGVVTATPEVLLLQASVRLLLEVNPLWLAKFRQESLTSQAIMLTDLLSRFCDGQDVGKLSVSVE